jgi:hypothetical protein
VSNRVHRIEDVTAVFDSGKALKCMHDDLGEFWVPHSCIDGDSEVYDAGDNSEGTLVVALWFAEKEKLCRE